MVNVSSAAKERFGTSAVFNYLPNGQVNPSRFKKRRSIERASKFRGKFTHEFCFIKRG